MKKLAALLSLLFAACYSSGQLVSNLSPLNIVIQYPNLYSAAAWCLYEFKNTGSDTLSINTTRERINVFPNPIPPSARFIIDWNWQEGKKSRQQTIIPFQAGGRRFNVTISRTIDTSRKPLLLAMDSSVFDRGHVLYAQHSDYTIDWKVKNISAMEVLCPTEIDVWGDCDIFDRFTKKSPLPAGKTRVIKLRVHFAANGYKKQKHGWVNAIADVGGKRFVQAMFVSVSACFDEPLPSDTLRRW